MTDWVGPMTDRYTIPQASIVVRSEISSEDSKGDSNWIDESVLRVFFVYTNLESIEGMGNAIYHQGPWLLQVFPYRSDELVCKGLVASGEPFFYLYETLSFKLGIRLPFIQFERALKKKGAFISSTLVAASVPTASA
ncbi:hypothetical protein CR513_55607, partial [Mucuna pruriens]